MSEMSNEAIQDQIERNKDDSATVKSGDAFSGGSASSALYADANNLIQTGGAMAASKPIYSDSAKVPQAANIPFATQMAGLIVDGLLTTTVSAFSITGTSNPDTAELLLQGQLVLGSQVTTWTKTGFIQVNIVDDGGNLTDGVHYIQIGTLT